MERGGTRNQKPRDFTVQIRHSTKPEKAIGAGVIVSADGKIVTCAHVIRDAGVNPDTRQPILSEAEWLLQNVFKRSPSASSEEESALVGVYFPQTQRRKGGMRHARILGCLDEYDDDIVLLQIVGEKLSLATEEIAVLGAADFSEGDRFTSYGYPLPGQGPDTHVMGTILGRIDPPEDGRIRLCLPPIQLKSEDIDKGCSGAAVFDEERNLVVGIIMQTWPDTTATDRYTAWAVNARVLTSSPFDLPVREAPLERSVVARPEVAGIDVQELVRETPLEKAFYNAPAPLEEWIERKELLQRLQSDWLDPGCHITACIGSSVHAGKTALVRQWVENVEQASISEPLSLFWWSFHSQPDVAAFLAALLTYVSGGRVDPQGFSMATSVQIIASILLHIPQTNHEESLTALPPASDEESEKKSEERKVRATRRYLIVLDGLDIMQHQESESYGLLKSAELAQLFSYLAASNHTTFCLVTSRLSLDLNEYTTYREYLIDPLSRNVVLQNLLDFTVKILHPTQHERTIGTGIVVSTEGHIVTCARVLQSVVRTNRHARTRMVTDIELGVYFLRLREKQAKLRRARVVGSLPEHDDDILLLQLLDGPAPLAPERIAILGAADESERHPFRSYGYRRLDTYSAGRADGQILGIIDPPAGLKLQAEPIELRSSEINQEMQGAPVLDIERNLIVGIVYEKRAESRFRKNADKSLAVNARILRLDPFALPVRQEPLEKRPAPQPKTDLSHMRALAPARLAANMERAPRALEIWIGRTNLLAEMNESWKTSRYKMTGIVGFGGEGKSSIAR